jgi:hypothetical protein
MRMMLSMTIMAVMAMGVMVRPWSILADASHVVMMTILRLTDSRLESW